MRGVSERAAARIRRAAGQAISAIEEIRSADQSFKIHLADGRVFRYRRLRSGERRSRVARHLETLAGRHFPRLIAAEDPWLCTEWIEGAPMLDPAGKVEPGRIEAVARMQAEIHEETGREREKGRAWAETVKELAGRRLARLASSGLLSEGERDLASGLVSRSRIECGPLSVVHRDLSAKNLLFRGGVPVSIDNEHLGVHFADYDFWKAVLYLKLDREGERAYRSAYCRVDPRESLAEDETFWRLYVLVAEVHLRAWVNRTDFRRDLAALRRRLAAPVDL